MIFYNKEIFYIVVNILYKNILYSCEILEISAH